MKQLSQDNLKKIFTIVHAWDLALAESFGQTISQYLTDNNYQTQAQVTSAINTAIEKVVGAAPEALDTLAELAAAIDNDDSAAAGIIQQIAALRATLNNTYTKDQVNDLLAGKISPEDFVAFTDDEILDAANEIYGESPNGYW